MGKTKYKVFEDKFYSLLTDFVLAAGHTTKHSHHAGDVFGAKIGRNHHLIYFKKLSK